MARRGDGSDSRRSRRHELENEQRGRRARQHLARVRESDRQRLRERERARERARQQAAAPASRLRRRGVLALAFVLALLAGLAWGAPALDRLLGLGDGDFLRIEAIAVQGQQRLDADAVAAATGVVRGSLLRDVDVAAVEARLAAEPWVRASRVMRLPTGTLIVRIEERQPVAVLQISGAAIDSDRGLLIDTSGTPFAPASQVPHDGLPRLVVAAMLAKGMAHPELQAALALCRRLAERPLPAIGAAASPLDLRLPTTGSQEGWVLQSRDRSFEAVLGLEQVEERLERLARLLATRLPEAREAVRIDLRFADRAVLRSAPASS